LYAIIFAHPTLLRVVLATFGDASKYVNPSKYVNHSERVVVGQRMIQAATDIFLGWTGALVDERYFYIRRLKDSRLADIGTQMQAALPFYASLCGRTLARAHARAGDPALVSGYVGSGTAFEEAIGEFAVTYRDQTVKDWKSFKAAIKAGRIPSKKG
jgi:hypothetical protein